MIRVNLAPAFACDAGPTTGCHEQGRDFSVLHDGRAVETRVLCRHHRFLAVAWYGRGYLFVRPLRAV